ncbi:MAG TPA: ATP-binding protein [Tepidisphaeraceae bacterium]|nr:ATP-binding protein [Tepidisphaeraceae bacterium]
MGKNTAARYSLSESVAADVSLFSQMRENEMNLPVEPNGQWLLEFDRPPIQMLSPDEIFERADEELLRNLFEDYRLELKPNGIHPDALAPYFSMWSNTSPGGLVAIGIRDDKKFEGCARLSAKRLNGLELTAEVYCPDADNKVKRVLIHRDDDGASDFVLLFHVLYNPSRVVKTVGGKVYVRRANRMKELRTPDEIRQLQSEKGEVRFESEPCDLRYPHDFDNPALSDFVASVRAKKGWEDDHSNEDILQLMHLGVLDQGVFTPNIACAILFAIDPRSIVAGCRIRFLRFEGESEGVGDKWNAVKDEFVDGTVPRQIERTAAMVKAQLRTFSRLGPGGKFFTQKEYPEFAWYEAIVNACVHRSYGNGMRNTPIFVKIFDDRFVVESPGAFPPFVTNQNIHEMHVPRNPFLMDAMYFLKYVKCAHEGTRRMKAEMLEMELPAPEWKQEEIGRAIVRVTLKNNVKHRRFWVDSDVVQLLGAQIAHTLSSEEKRVINFCAENHKINVSDAQRLTAKDWGGAKKILMGLVKKNILEHVHSKSVLTDPKAHYILKGSRKIGS